MTLQISYQDWSDFLIRIGAVCGPSELHGMLCGSLCTGKVGDPGQWASSAYGFLDLLEDTDDREVRGALEAFFEMAQSTMKEQGYGLHLLLPDDAVPLPDRGGALARWCQGFLHGFGSGGEGIALKLEEDAQDALRDIAEIARLEQNEASEEDEQLYVELVEYVRLAVFDMYAQLNVSHSAMDDVRAESDPIESDPIDTAGGRLDPDGNPGSHQDGTVH